MSEIRQLVPAQGWFARFDHGDGLEYVPLVAWALLADQEDSRYPQTGGDVVGIIADWTTTRKVMNEDDDFGGYVYDPERTSWLHDKNPQQEAAAA